MIGLCVGGSKHGEMVDSLGVELRVPFIDADYNRAHMEWGMQWGVADAWARSGPDYDLLAKIPRPPKIPVEVYRWQSISDSKGGVIRYLMLDRIDR